MRALLPVPVHDLLTGQAVPFGPNGEPSAIGKRRVTTTVRLTELGLAGDEQGDRRHHGGPDKALHHYPVEHYPTWCRELPGVSADRWQVGGFGENISTSGLTEDNVCLGDVFLLDKTLVQVSQARQPCWKLNVRFGLPDMARRVQDSGRTGWYYRVLETGEVSPGCELRLVERPHPDWPLARLLHHLYIDPLDGEALAAIAGLELLASGWRQLAARRLACGRVEEWSFRLDTPRAATT